MTNRYLGIISIILAVFTLIPIFGAEIIPVKIVLIIDTIFLFISGFLLHRR